MIQGCPGWPLGAGFDPAHCEGCRDRDRLASQLSEAEAALKYGRDAIESAQASEHAAVAHLRQVEAERDVAKDEALCAGRVVEVAVDWIRKLAEFAPLLHAADRKEGEALARAWLKTWDECGATIGKLYIDRLRAAEASLQEARTEIARP
ncbi:MAG TPA: hypothetical protein VN697_03345 [Tepidiformaceae bacterium]|jgi:hypothetical protein|nr:hypothetical protein [Tepidiformaceae bacterium]